MPSIYSMASTPADEGRRLQIKYLWGSLLLIPLLRAFGTLIEENPCGGALLNEDGGCAAGLYASARRNAARKIRSLFELSLCEAPFGSVGVFAWGGGSEKGVRQCMLSGQRGENQIRTRRAWWTG